MRNCEAAELEAVFELALSSYLTFWGHPGDGLSIRGTCSADAERLEAMVSRLVSNGE